MFQKFKYLTSGLDESDREIEECRSEVVSKRKTGGGIRFLVHVRGLQFECARMLHETLLVPVLLNGIETVI